MTDDLAATLETLAAAAQDLRGPWWVFGGAAMVLAGLDDLATPDVDVLAAPEDARRLIAALGGAVEEDPGHGLFRSRVFGRVTTTPIPIEVMADMDVRAATEWTRVAFDTRLPLMLDAGPVFIPSIDEQIATCCLFGRPKDLQRAARLEGLGSPPQ
jgi:hypothetical protein